MFIVETFNTEKEAVEYKKLKRWRKCTISYNDSWKCWTLTRTEN